MVVCFFSCFLLFCFLAFSEDNMGYPVLELSSVSFELCCLCCPRCSKGNPLVFCWQLDFCPCISEQLQILPWLLGGYCLWWVKLKGLRSVWWLICLLIRSWSYHWSWSVYSGRNSCQRARRTLSYYIILCCWGSCCTLSILLCGACMSLPICWECLSLYLHMCWRRVKPLFDHCKNKVTTYIYFNVLSIWARGGPVGKGMQFLSNILYRDSVFEWGLIRKTLMSSKFGSCDRCVPLG